MSMTHLADVGAPGQVVHRVQQHLFEDRPQAAGAGAAQQRLFGDGLQAVGAELQLDVLELEHLLVLPNQRVLRLGEDAHQRLLVERAHRPHRRQPADELGDHPVLDEVLGQHLGEQLARIALRLRLHRAVEADALVADAALDDLLQPGERATEDEQHVRRVDLDELLVRVLAPALRGDRRLRALEDLQQRLLHTLAGHVTGDRRVLALAGDLVDLVDVDDPRLGPLDVEVGGLDQLEQDVLDVLADIAGLGQRRGVGDGEGHVEQPGQRLGQVRLAAARGAEQEDVRLRQLDLVAPADAHRLLVLDAPVVVVDGDGEDLLGALLADDVVVEERADLTRVGQVVEAQLGGLGELLFDDLVAQVDALVADVHAWPGDQLADLLLRLATERALEQFAGVTEFGHARRLPCRLSVVSTVSGSRPSGRTSLGTRSHCR